MIESIEKVKNLGIYKDISEPSCSDFKRFNLIYGWNGSGKSTLSRLFKSIDSKECFADYPDMEFSFKSNGGIYTSDNLELFTEKVAVFNTDFVHKNIDWNGIIKSILYIDETNIELAKEYAELKKQLYGAEDVTGDIKKLQDLKSDREKKKSELDRMLSGIAKTVKTNFQTIDMSDSRYLNYNRKNVIEMLEGCGKTAVTQKDALSNAELEDIISAARGQSKLTQMKQLQLQAAINRYSDMLLKINELCSASISNTVIKELKNDPELSVWAERGLELHKEKKLKHCAFCGSPISKDRLNELDGHFNDAYNNLIYNINSQLKVIKEKLYYESEIILSINEFYDEFRNRVTEQILKYEKNISVINGMVDSWVKSLEDKRCSPFVKIQVKGIDQGFRDALDNISQVENIINVIIKEHNDKTKQFETEKRSAQEKLERHFIVQELNSTGYRKNKKEYDEIEKRISEMDKAVKTATERYHTIEKVMSSETLASTEFNKKLKAFLGHSEIELVFDADSGGYKIYRNNNAEAKNLSEGEKTAIAFTYFVTKLKESGHAIKDYILVIDDPISSFDSNKIFAAYAYLKSECEDAKQLFVFTHNYNYFSLILGWFQKRKKNVDGKKVPDFMLYRIENGFEKGSRYAILKDGGETMKQSTEYDYVFYNVYRLKDADLSKEELIFCGNICRKLLESFLSFKFPKQRADYRALLEAAYKDSKDTVKLERIYRFTNIYSHDKKINALEELDTDIMMANASEVINDVLDLMRHLDSAHFDAMVEKIKDELN